MASVPVVSRPPVIVHPPFESSEIIYVDNSILSTFMTCNEKGRLSYVEHWRPNKTQYALDFGACFHAGVQAYYEGLNATILGNSVTAAAENGFITEWKARGGSLPTSLDDEEKRSLERGLWMLKAYIQRWTGEPFVNVLKDDGSPYTEMGFAVHLMDWIQKDLAGALHTVPVMFVGRWDRIMRSRVDGKLYVFEVKTTSQGLNHYALQVKPNHQITGYVYAAKELLGLDVAGVIWDCAFVSSRKPDSSARNDPWKQVGIDIEKDFSRTETRRSSVDIQEWLYDIRLATSEFLHLKDSMAGRWYRNAPTACHMFGGCSFRDVCASNLNENILNTNFHREVWTPWKGITE